jgi:hypothetical protein
MASIWCLNIKHQRVTREAPRRSGPSVANSLDVFARFRSVRRVIIRFDAGELAPAFDNTSLKRRDARSGLRDVVGQQDYRVRVVSGFVALGLQRPPLRPAEVDDTLVDLFEVTSLEREASPVRTSRARLMRATDSGGGSPGRASGKPTAPGTSPDAATPCARPTPRPPVNSTSSPIGSSMPTGRSPTSPSRAETACPPVRMPSARPLRSHGRR